MTTTTTRPPLVDQQQPQVGPRHLQRMLGRPLDAEEMHIWLFAQGLRQTLNLEPEPVVPAMPANDENVYEDDAYLLRAPLMEPRDLPGMRPRLSAWEEHLQRSRETPQERTGWEANYNENPPPTYQNSKFDTPVVEVPAQHFIALGPPLIYLPVDVNAHRPYTPVIPPSYSQNNQWAVPTMPVSPHLPFILKC